ncbi:MAG: amidohydrolase [Bacillota bacterium]
MGKIDVILVNGRIHEVIGEPVRSEAVAISGGKVVATGSTEQMEIMADRDTKRIDLEGRTVIPGLTDSHLHLLGYGLQLGRVDLAPVRSMDEFLARVAEVAGRLPVGRWVLGRGWDQDRLAEKRFPTRQDLDRVAPDHPVVLGRNCGHLYVANSLALKLAGVDRDTAAPPGGQIDRDEQGEPTGVLRETAQGLIHRVVPPPDRAEKLQALRLAVQRALSFGLTSIHPDDVGLAGGWEEAEGLYRQLIVEEEIPLRVHLAVSISHLDELIEMGLATGAGDDWLRVGAAKIFADGSLGGRTAALSEPYSDDPSTAGIPIHPEEELNQLVARANEHGMQVQIHAIGDRAVEMSLNAIERALEAHPRVDHRHRLVHAQILREDLIKTMVRLKVLADVQPKFISSDLHWAGQRVGRERLTWSYCFRTMLEMGVGLAGGSDAPVEPLEPFLGIFAAVNRTDLDGQPKGGWTPGERVNINQAIRLFAEGGPYAAFEEHRRGALVPGRLADLVVLDSDPWRVDPAQLKEIRPLLTMVGGRIGFRSGGWGV